MKRNLKFYSILLGITVMLSACGGGGTGDDNSGSGAIDVSKLNANCFVPSPFNPLLTTNSQFSNANWNDPSVIKIGDTYIMYASADTNFSGDIKIYRLTSSDGINFTLNPSTAVFSKASGPADWDRKSVETPSVVFFNNQYHMFYTAYPTSLNIVTDYKIGHATSDDGITWTRDASYLLAPNDPLNTSPNLSFDQYVVAEPGALVFNNKLFVYFTAQGADIGVGSTLFTIGMINSDDGVNWSPPSQVLRPDQGLYPRAAYHGYSTPAALEINGKAYLFFDVAEDPFVQSKLHYAVSNDGINAFVEHPQEIFDRSMFDYTSTQIRAPSPLLDGDSLKLYFAGNNVLDLSIALSSCDLSS